MKVKIIKATEINTEENGVVLPWYKNDIGEIFEVSDETTMINGRESYQVIQYIMNQSHYVLNVVTVKE